MTQAHITSQAVEVLYTRSATPKARVTTETVEVLSTRNATPKANVTNQGVETLYTPTALANIHVSQQVIEVLYSSVLYEAQQADPTSTPQAEITYIGDSVNVPKANTLGNNNATGVIYYIGNSPIALVADILVSVAYIPTTQSTTGGYITQDLETFDVDYYPYHITDIPFALQPIAITNNLPIDTVTFPINISIIDLSYLIDFYYRIHFSIDRLDLSNILSEQYYELGIWNSWFVNDTLTSANATDLTGITIEGPYPLPYTFTPLQFLTFTITATVVGSQLIDGYFTFTFGFETIIFEVTGQSVTMWSFCPLAEHTEVREWLTDVLPAKGSETSYAMRDKARKILNYSYRFLDREVYTLCKVLAEGLVHQLVGVPGWTDAVKVYNILAGDSIIYFDTTYLEIDVDIPVVFWHSYKNYEIGIISEIYDDRIVLRDPLTASHNPCLIMPINVAYLNDVNFQHGDNHSLTGSVSALIDDSYYNPIWPNTETFQTLPVLTQPLVVTGGLEIAIAREQVTADSLTGYRLRIDNENYTRWGHTFSAKAENPIELFALRRQLDYLKGRFNRFWLPSFTNDIIALSGLTSGINTIHIIKEQFDLYTPRYIRIIGTDDSIVYAEIGSIADNFDGTAVLTITPIPTADLEIKQIEIMKKMRLDSDSNEYAHQHLVGENNQKKYFTKVKIPVKEVLN